MPLNLYRDFTPPARSYEVTPVNTKDLARVFLRPLPRVEFSAVPNKDFKRALLRSLPGSTSRLYGIRSIEVSGMADVGTYGIGYNGGVVDRLTNPQGKDQISLDLMIDEDDCLLVEVNLLPYTDLKVWCEPRPGRYLPREIRLSVVPLVLGPGVLGPGVLDLPLDPNDLSFDYYSVLGPPPPGSIVLDSPGTSPRYLIYSQGFMGVVDGVIDLKSYTKTLRERVEVLPKIRSENKILRIDPSDEVRVGPTLEVQRASDVTRILVPTSRVAEILKECPKTTVEGPETYWTEEQQKDMHGLSDNATLAKYATYCLLKGLDVPKLECLYFKSTQ